MTYTIPHRERIARNWMSRVLTLSLVVVGTILAIEFREQQRAAAQNELDKLKASLRAELIVASSPYAHITCDEDGTIILCNPAAEKLLGYPHDGLDGINSLDLIPEGPDRRLHQVGMDRAAAEIKKFSGNYQITRRDMPMRALRADGTIVDVTACIRVIKYYDTVEFVVTMRAARPEDDINVPRALPLPELPIQKEIESRQSAAL